jgi:hypothetical protein
MGRWPTISKNDACTVPNVWLVLSAIGIKNTLVFFYSSGISKMFAYIIACSVATSAAAGVYYYITNTNSTPILCDDSENYGENDSWLSGESDAVEYRSWPNM